MKPKSTATILAIVIFFGGVGAGVFLDRILLEKGAFSHFKHFKKFMGPERFERIVEYLQNKFTKELGLSLPQQEELSKILVERMALMKSRAKEQDQEMEMLKEATRQQIRQILNPDQKKRFEELVAEYQARRAKYKN